MYSQAIRCAEEFGEILNAGPHSSRSAGEPLRPSETWRMATGSRGNCKGETSEFSAGASLNLFSHNSKGQSLDKAHRLLTGYSVGHATGQARDFCNPAPVFLAVDFQGNRHGVNITSLWLWRKPAKISTTSETPLRLALLGSPVPLVAMVLNL